MIPAIIICYNNWVYVKNTIEQLEKINSQSIHIIKILRTISKVFFCIKTKYPKSSNSIISKSK